MDTTADTSMRSCRSARTEGRSSQATLDWCRRLSDTHTSSCRGSTHAAADSCCCCCTHIHTSCRSAPGLGSTGSDTSTSSRSSAVSDMDTCCYTRRRCSWRWARGTQRTASCSCTNSRLLELRDRDSFVRSRSCSWRTAAARPDTNWCRRNCTLSGLAAVLWRRMASDTSTSSRSSAVSDMDTCCCTRSRCRPSSESGPTDTTADTSMRSCRSTQTEEHSSQAPHH